MKALLNQIRSFGSEELKAKIKELAPDSLPQLLSEVNARIERVNLLEGVNYSTDVAGIINEALSEIDFAFRCRGREELKFYFNGLRERYRNVLHEFDVNFDRHDDKYVNLVDAFKEFFRKRGFVPKDVVAAKEAIGYMDDVMARIREINRRNAMLKRKYREDEKFARIHKRICEVNAKRTIPPAKPLISLREAEVMENLNRIKDGIDKIVYYNVLVLDNSSGFNQDVLQAVSLQLNKAGIKASIDDRKFIQQHIAQEYIADYACAN